MELYDNGPVMVNRAPGSRFNLLCVSDFHLFIYFSPLFNQVGELRTSSHLQLRPGQDKA
jgi:hypothetical protein